MFLVVLVTTTYLKPQMANTRLFIWTFIYIFDNLSYLRNPLPQKNMHRESIHRTTGVLFLYIYTYMIYIYRARVSTIEDDEHIIVLQNLTYPTYGRRTWSSQLPSKGMCLKSIGQLNYISHSDGCMILTAVAQWMSHESSCDCIVGSYIFDVSLFHTFQNIESTCSILSVPCWIFTLQNSETEIHPISKVN